MPVGGSMVANRLKPATQSTQLAGFVAFCLISFQTTKDTKITKKSLHVLRAFRGKKKFILGDLLIPDQDLIVINRFDFTLVF